MPQKLKRQPTPCACGAHVFAPLTKYGVALVSPEDAQHLRRNWSMSLPGGYAYSWNGPLKKNQYLHRVIMPEAVRIDHKNGNGLDNRRDNIRECTQSQNMANRRTVSKTGFKGVYKHRNSPRWVAAICNEHLGTFNSPEEAAQAYNKAAVERFGEFSKLNEVTI